MATALSRRSAKKVKVLTTEHLNQLIKTLQVSVPEQVSLLEAAKRERRYRHLKKLAKASLQEKMEIDHE